MACRRAAFAFALLESVLAATQTPTATASVTSIFLPGFDQQSLVASVITASPSATTYFLQCGSGDQLDCGIGSGMTLTEGPSTFEININSTEMTISEACALFSDTASCTYSIGGGDSGSESTSGLQPMYLNVTITAGFEAIASASSLAAAQAAAATAAVTALDTATGSAAGTATASVTGATAVETTNGMGSAGAIGARWDIGRIAVICGVAAGLLAW